MKPHTRRLIETLIRLSKGMLTALEAWLKETEAA